MNLALLGDPYYVRMILKNAHSVYKNCETIYVSQFLHTDDAYDIPQELVSIENVMVNPYVVDEVLTFCWGSSMFLPLKKILNNAHKKIPVKNINIQNIPKLFEQKNYNATLLKKRPAILSLSIGPASQQYHVEMLINRYLRKMNMNFY